ncbi:MAG TPA: DUF1698 domain-containing protein [Candidatus Bathyarchaeia archaeon]|nr:DUF1698 domain-containing protein [Candidatus Bathyarchaeia archaeon]
MAWSAGVRALARRFRRSAGERAQTPVRPAARGRRPPAAPAGFNPERLFAGVFWFQRWEIFDGVFTPGGNPIDELCDDLRLPEDLSGKRVLDIGAWNGCLSFECERRGAREVVALGPEDPSRTGFDRIRALLGAERTRYVVGSVYDLDPAELGSFDLVLFCGVLYHLRYPLLGIDNIRRVCRGEVLIETFVSDAQFVLRRGETLVELPLAKVAPELTAAPLWLFFRRDELSQDASNWFGPNAEAVEQAFDSAGFSTELLATMTRGTSSRATFRALRRDGPPEFLTIGSVEGTHYDATVRPLFGAPKLDFGLADALEYDLVDGLRRADAADASSWLEGTYRMLLGRSPGSAERAGALERLGDGGQPEREELAIELVRSRAYRVHLLSRCYELFLSRSGSAGEIESWLGLLDGGHSLERAVIGFVASDEHFARSGGTNAAWLARLATDLSGRPLEAARATLAVLEAGTTSRGAVARRFLDDAENRASLLRRLFPL